VQPHSLTKGQKAIRDFAEAMVWRKGIAQHCPALAIAISLLLMGPALGEQPVTAGGSGQGVHHVLVIPVNLRGFSMVTVDHKQVAQALFGAQDSVASRYRALSYGAVRFEGSQKDIADPVILSAPDDFCNTGLSRLASEAEREASQRGMVLSAYQHFVFVLPKDGPCWWTGLGDVGGNRVWVKATTAKALQHELGHNLGMNHAVNWHGRDAEGSDLMGSGVDGLNGPHIVELGWLQRYPAKIVNLTHAADVTLETLETDPRISSLPKVAIVQPARGANVYYLSYRTSSADNAVPETFTRGLNMHIAEASRSGALTYFVGSLSDGAFYDDGPMVIRQLSHTKEQVTFRIAFTGGSEAMAAGPPPAPPGTVQSIASGKCMDLPAGRTEEGTVPIQYDCHGGPNQLWDIKSESNGYRIVSRMSGKCVGIELQNAVSGGHVVQSQCSQSAVQFWALEESVNGYVLRNAANGLCLDVPQASAANGVSLISWPCNGGTNQIWRYAGATDPRSK
jgi:hypothetical protein